MYTYNLFYKVLYKSFSFIYILQIAWVNILKLKIM